MEKGAGVPVDLGSLACEAGTRPVLNVTTHPWPDCTLVDDAVGVEDARIIQGVVMFKFRPTVLPGDEWARGAVRHVTP